MKKTTKTITIKLTDSQRQKLEVLRGGRSVSAFIRGVLFDQHPAIKQEAEALQQLIQDVAVIRVKLNQPTSANVAFPAVDFFQPLAIYLTEIIKLGNPPTYSNQRDKIKSLFNDLMDKLEEVSNEKR